MIEKSNAFSDDDILDILTDGERDINTVFLRNGFISFWQPESEFVLTMLLDNDGLSLACKDFLARRQAIYNTKQEIATAARKYHWPKWELLQKRCDE